MPPMPCPDFGALALALAWVVGWAVRAWRVAVAV